MYVRLKLLALIALDKPNQSLEYMYPVDLRCDKRKRYYGYVQLKHISKRYFIIDQQISGILCTTVNVFQTHLPFYASKISKPFLTSRISANHDKGF